MFVLIDETWHVKERDYIGENGNFQYVETACGITEVWNGIQIDALPGGDEKVHADCGSASPSAKKAKSDDDDEAEESAPKARTTRKK